MGVGDQVGTRLTQLSTGLKLKLKLGKYIHFKDTVSDRIFLKIKLSLEEIFSVDMKSINLNSVRRFIILGCLNFDWDDEISDVKI